MADELEGYPEGTEDLDDITFDDAPPQDKAEVVARAVEATKVLTTAPKAVKAAKAAAVSTPVAAPKPPKSRKPRKLTVAKTAKKQHRVDTIDNNKLAAYLDNLVNVEGYQLISVTGSSSIMGAFTVVSVKG